MPASRPRRGVVGEAEVDCDAVGGFEADAVNLAGDAVGLVDENLAGLAAVFVNQLHALAGGDAVSLEEDVELAEGALLVPGSFNGGGADLADTRDIAQAAGFLAQHAEGISPEGVGDLVGVNLAHARDETRAEVFTNPIHAGGEFGSEGLDLKLGAMLGVAGPSAAQTEGFAALDPGEGANDGDACVAAIGHEFGDGVVVLLVGEDDALQDAVEAVGGGGSGGGGWRRFGHG